MRYQEHDTLEIRFKLPFKFPQKSFYLHLFMAIHGFRVKFESIYLHMWMHTHAFLTLIC